MKRIKAAFVLSFSMFASLLAFPVLTSAQQPQAMCRETLWSLGPGQELERPVEQRSHCGDHGQGRRRVYLHLPRPEPAASLQTVEFGADVNARNMEGLTPLAVAEKQKHTEVATLLKSHGAKWISKPILPFRRDAVSRPGKSTGTSWRQITDYTGATRPMRELPAICVFSCFLKFKLERWKTNEPTCRRAFEQTREMNIIKEEQQWIGQEFERGPFGSFWF